MEDSLTKWIIISISVVLMASLVSTIAWTFVIGHSLVDDLQSRAIVYYSEAGLSMMVDSSNLDDIDATNVYKVMEVNRNIIVDYAIKNLDGTYENDPRALLKRPTDRFNVVIEGDSAIGFKVEVNEVPTTKVGE